MKITIVLIVFGLGLNHSFADDQKFSMSEYHTYSHIPIKTVRGDIPFKKPYEKLTKVQKMKFLERYENLPESIEPPFPGNGLQQIYEPIIYAQKRLRVEGILHVVAIVDKNGEVKKVNVYSTPSKEMSKVVSIALFETKFKSALCSGKPCQFEFPLKTNFKL